MSRSNVVRVGVASGVAAFVVLLLVSQYLPRKGDFIAILAMGVLFLVMLQTGYLTPPMAPSIFYLRGIAPPEITIHDMFRGVVPFIVVQVICLVIVAAFPPLVLWLPSVLLGFK